MWMLSEDTMRSPFITQRVISYGEPFCDREEEIGKILESASRGEAVCLLSPRRYGKSSLMNQVLGKLRRQNWVTLQLDLMNIFSLDAFVERLEAEYASALSYTERVWTRAREAATGMRPRMEVDPLSGRPSVTIDLLGPQSSAESRLLNVLRAVIALPEKTGAPVCLAMDEFQQIASFGPGSQIEGVIRSVFQYRPDTFFPFFLGSRRHALRLMFENESAPFYRSARVVSLGPLPAAAFEIFMVDQFKKTLDLDIPDRIAAATHRLFGGHPHAMNRTASYLWTSLCGNRDLSSVVELWKNRVIEIIQEESGYYEVVSQNIARYAMNVLHRIAVAGIVHEPYSAAFAKSCGLTPGQIQNALRILRKEEKVAEDEQGISLLDPIEAICLRMIGASDEAGREALGRLLEEIAVMV